jgi:DNA-binding Lrp family transcriptional regulator
MADEDWVLLSALLRQPTQHVRVGKGAEHQHGGDAQRLVRRLKKHDAYGGWRLEVDRQAMGLGVTAFIFVKLRGQDAETLRHFKKELSASREVVRLVTLSGEFDFMVEFAGADVAALDSFRADHLTANDMVKGTTTMISLE